jgi:hypothetical protein
MLYSYTKLSKWDFSFFRFLGPGLGNLLFPWARFILVTQKYGLTPISPTWFQIKLGPMLRREADKRFYFDLFKKNPEEISGIKKLIVLLKYSLVTEDYVEYLKSGIPPPKNKIKIIVFTGLRDYFNSIITEHSFVYNKLLKIARDEHKKGLYFDFQKSVSVHIRLGDFKGSNATPIQWYINTLHQLRAELGSGWPIYIFSDGTDEELMPVMRLPNTTRLTFGSSLADLLALSKAHLLIGSAGSTFSQWASFLGRMPVIWPKGSLTQHLYYDNPLLEIECAQEEKLSEDFIAICKQNA